MTQSPITSTGCEVCGDPVLWNKLCRKCDEQKERIAEIRKQKKRDAAFGNVFKEAGVRDD